MMTIPIMGPRKFLCGLRAAIFSRGYRRYPKMHPAENRWRIPISSPPNNFVPVQPIMGPRKFLCGLRAAFFSGGYWRYPKMHPAIFFWNPTIKTPFYNLMIFTQKLPPFRGCGGGILQFMTHIFLFRIWKYLTSGFQICQKTHIDFSHRQSP